MGVRFFGQYLLENRVINGEQLLAGIAHQEKTNRKFGETAVSLGLLTEEQLKSILALQRSEDLMTGEAAVALGLLNEAQVQQVLRAQQNSHVLIGEALIAVGVLTPELLARHLTAYRVEQDSFRISETVPKDLDPTGIATPAVDLAVKFLLRLTGLPAKLVDCRGTLPAADGATCTARVGFTGDVAGEIGLRAAPVVGARIASGMAGETIAVDDRGSILDGTREFLNVLVGNLAAHVAGKGTRLEVTAPLDGELPLPGDAEQFLAALFRVPEGDLDFAVTTRPPQRR